MNKPGGPDVSASVFAPMPWPQAMAFGFGVLGLAPSEFWSMTPRELTAALSIYATASPGSIAPRPDELANLMQRHPDRPESQS